MASLLTRRESTVPISRRLVGSVREARGSFEAHFTGNTIESVYVNDM